MVTSIPHESLIVILQCKLLLVAPAGKIMALNKTEVEVLCKENVTANKLPEWIFEPSVNESMSLGCIRLVLELLILYGSHQNI